jgi:hypothetical protein
LIYYLCPQKDVLDLSKFGCICGQREYKIPTLLGTKCFIVVVIIVGAKINKKELADEPYGSMCSEN